MNRSDFCGYVTGDSCPSDGPCPEHGKDRPGQCVVAIDPELSRALAESYGDVAPKQDSLGMKKVVHLLRSGRALCGRPGIPGRWSDAERWTPAARDAIEEVLESGTGALCYYCELAFKGEPLPREAYAPVLVLNQFDEQICWCRRCHETFAFKLPVSAAMMSAVLSAFRKDHEFCRKGAAEKGAHS